MPAFSGGMRDLDDLDPNVRARVEELADEIESCEYCPENQAAPSGGAGLLEGVVDLAFEEDGEWTVVDFKTGTDLDVHQEEYMQQVGIYVEAIARATGTRARGLLLRV